TVVVADGRVAEVAAKAEPPAGVPVLDATGKTLLPGLVDAHTHTFGTAASDALVFGVTAELDMATDARLLPGFRRDREDLARSAAADVFSAGFLATAPKGHGTEYGIPVPTLTKPEEADAWVAARVAEGSDYIKLVLDDGSSWARPWPTLDKDVVAALV